MHRLSHRRFSCYNLGYDREKISGWFLLGATASYQVEGGIENNDWAKAAKKAEYQTVV
ncbi:MAG: hypothetical protein R3B53_02385 [Candidatus Paceibacterota bacterium]